MEDDECTRYQCSDRYDRDHDHVMALTFDWEPPYPLLSRLMNIMVTSYWGTTVVSSQFGAMGDHIDLR